MTVISNILEPSAFQKYRICRDISVYQINCGTNQNILGPYQIIFGILPKKIRTIVDQLAILMDQLAALRAQLATLLE